MRCVHRVADKGRMDPVQECRSDQSSSFCGCPPCFSPGSRPSTPALDRTGARYAGPSIANCTSLAA